MQNFITKTLKKFKWTVELDAFSTQTSIGVRKFTNIIATLHPKAVRFLVLAAHYDSKDPRGMDLGEGENFVAATDSAVPCAMLLDFAQHLSEVGDGGGVSPMLVFMDGEEAFEKWTDTDSLYGSRHLAKHFASRPHPDKQIATQHLTFLDSIDTFVLFDLIGSNNPPPQFWDLYRSTSHLYEHLQKVEGELKHSLYGQQKVYFPGKAEVEVEDDHLPFLKLGVSVLHLIPIPFPSSWHKVSDNEKSLDSDTIVNLLRIFRKFLENYFDTSE